MRLHAPVSVGLAALLCATSAGCGIILGLGDFQDAPASTGNPSSSGGAGGGSGGAGGGAQACEPGTTAPCYSGPAGTADVGICKTGTKTCNPDGIGYGPCMNAVAPATEVCDAPDDEDCDGFSCSVARWAKTFSGISSHAQSVAVSPEGDVVIAGTFAGQIDFGGGALLSAGGDDFFVARFDPSGKHVWSKRFGNAAVTSRPIVVRVASNGDVVLAGGFESGINFGGGQVTSAGGVDIFAVKLDGSGNHLWSQRFGDSADQTATGVAVDAFGDVVVTGTYLGTVVIGGATLTNTHQFQNDIFVAKLSAANGSGVWAKGFGNVGTPESAHLALDPTGGVLLAGNYSGTINFGGLNHTSNGSGNVFVAKFDTAGVYGWSRSFGNDTSTQSASGIASDATGNPVVTGTFNGTLNFGGQPFTSASNVDTFLLKLSGSNSGQHLFSVGFADTDATNGRAVAIDAGGNMVLTGGLSGSTYFAGAGNPPLKAPSYYSGFLAKFSPEATPIFGRAYGTPDGSTFVSAIATAPGTGAIALVGEFAGGTIDFGSGPVESLDTYHLFVAYIGP